MPHAIPKELFFPVDEKQKEQWKRDLIGPDKANWFTGFWVNRNARRKRPGDLLWAWSKCIDKIEKDTGKREALLILHTDPQDNEGPNLFELAKLLKIEENVCFSTDRVGFDQMNAMHNISDFVINVSYAEGFGLSTLEAMMTKTPIIAPKTGGQTRQVVDYRDESENGFALPIELQSLVGSQSVPYIYEDYTSTDTIEEKMYSMWKLGNEGREKLCQQAYDYANYEFG